MYNDDNPRSEFFILIIAGQTSIQIEFNHECKKVKIEEEIMMPYSGNIRVALAENKVNEFNIPTKKVTIVHDLSELSEELENDFMKQQDVAISYVKELLRN